MWFRIHQFLSKLIVASIIILCVFIGFNQFTSQPVLAAVRRMEEAPGQILIQSRHSLTDEQGNSWQVVLFKRSSTDGSCMIHLRLVDFPGLADFAHPHSLKITTNAGDSWEAKDMFAEKSPAANVGEFDVEDILLELPIRKLNLALPMKDNTFTQLSIPAEVVLEWQSIAEQN
jgi:hypothetical protein